MGAPGDGLPEWGPTIERRSGWGHSIREGSLIMGGGASEVLPLQKKRGGGWKGFSHSELGAQQVWDSFNTGTRGGPQKISSL